MAKLVWDAVGTRFFEAGVDQGVLYVYNPSTNMYGNGVPWNGLTAINEAPSGGEATPLYADNIKYVTLTSAEEFGFTIEAYTYPDEFAECDGKASPTLGVSVGQQTRSQFGLCYRTKIGNDVTEDAGYKIHVIYGAKASPSSVDRSTINDSPEGITFSWECTTTPVMSGNMKPTAHIEFDSRTLPEDKMTALLDTLYGGSAKEPTLPDFATLMGLVTGA